MSHPLSDKDQKKPDLLFGKSEAQNNPQISDILLTSLSFKYKILAC